MLECITTFIAVEKMRLKQRHYLKIFSAPFTVEIKLGLIILIYGCLIYIL